MSQAISFLPQWQSNARVLVLGSTPGVASLNAQQYYAHPRNAFWPILAQLCGFDAQLPYERRVEALKASGVALWDVIGRCYRPGSLDSSIQADTVEPNDLAELVARLPCLQLIACNGATAHKLLLRHWADLLAGLEGRVKVIRLPSTSPAHASLSLADKTLQWQVIGDYLDKR
ncbi:G:T/U mismatch-specific uracil/thymine DNA-glycosylase [Marinobacterium lacunae]|uniref:G:T/U mismatch-specific uracil/thymine DNA-glycosylase n=1 Tax=Marinobacterium lacunae TaxID=1232683 RepID=A0A081G093_9GAMM|nr:DNA-deoxyinosine glycosylase [Marinobacterium lacunae]KEA64198.1 G:T/U mismatch-specific uracil/thymine DNA-glycosylase [Marinobacterium lacunae]